MGNHWTVDGSASSLMELTYIYQCKSLGFIVMVCSSNVSILTIDAKMSLLIIVLKLLLLKRLIGI